MTVTCPCYRAENRAWAASAVFREVVADPQAFVTYVTEREPFVSLRRKAKLPEVFVTVSAGGHDKRSPSCAHLEEQHIDISRGAQPTQGLLLHEIAHLCSPNDAHHDHRYCANYLTLVRTWLGSLAAEILLLELRRERAFP